MKLKVIVEKYTFIINVGQGFNDIAWFYCIFLIIFYNN